MLIAIFHILFRSGAEKEDADGLEQDLDVEPEAPVLCVVEFEFDALVEGQVAAARNLPETSQT